LKGSEMTTDETTAGAGKTGPLPFDTGKAHQARIYDYALGGRDNYAADRAAAEAIFKVNPEMAFSARANRAFLGRAVRFLAADAGMRQFLDIGTGIPTAGNTHEVAQEIAPESQVVYVDYDPIVLAHARALLTSGEAGATEYIEADLRDTSAILERAGELLDFAKPVAITLLAILHAIPDADDLHAIVAKLLAAVPSGSYLVISHVGTDLLNQTTQQGLEDVADRMMQQGITYRTGEQVARFFEGTDLMDPGLVRVEEWQPSAEAASPERSSLWCAVGRKR
jgi:S-adenosyl methyltransferase